MRTRRRECGRAGGSVRRLTLRRARAHTEGAGRANNPDHTHIGTSENARASQSRSEASKANTGRAGREQKPESGGAIAHGGAGAHDGASRMQRLVRRERRLEQDSFTAGERGGEGATRGREPGAWRGARGAGGDEHVLTSRRSPCQSRIACLILRLKRTSSHKRVWTQAGHGQAYAERAGGR